MAMSYAKNTNLYENKLQQRILTFHCCTVCCSDVGKLKEKASVQNKILPDLN